MSDRPAADDGRDPADLRFELDLARSKIARLESSLRRTMNRLALLSAYHGVRAEQLTLNPDDHLVLICPHTLSGQEAEELRSRLSRHFPNHDIAILAYELDLTVMPGRPVLLRSGEDPDD